MLTDIYMKAGEDSMNGFQVIEWTQEWQTDRQTPGEKQYVSNPKGGDINIGSLEAKISLCSQI